jgi:hypothetical protein
MLKFKNRVGKKYGRWLVLSRVGTNAGRQCVWLCKCDCGNTSEVISGNLQSGHSKSCGCLKIERGIEVNTKHGFKCTKFYTVWVNLRARCNDENHKYYKNYGGRGITYDKKWENFLEFKKDMYQSYVFAKKKYRNALTKNNAISIERKDVNDNYNKNNCIWIPMGYQFSNRRNNK